MALENATAEKPMTFWSAVSLGVGEMIGAGIVALLEEAGSIAGSAMYLTQCFGPIEVTLQRALHREIRPRVLQ